MIHDAFYIAGLVILIPIAFYILLALGCIIFMGSLAAFSAPAVFFIKLWNTSKIHWVLKYLIIMALIYLLMTIFSH